MTLPPRVVSLLPSATDIIAVAGGADLLVGRSHECNWPREVERLPVLTGAVNEFVDSKQMDDVVKASLDRGEGLYFLEQELLKKLEPDVILTQDLCNVCSVDLQLVQQTIDQLSIRPTVVALNPQNLSDVLEDIIKVGKAVGREQQSQTAVAGLQARVQAAQVAAQAACKGQDPIKVAFVEWLEPLFVGGHWTPEMIRMAGGVHPLNMPIGDGGAGPSIRITNQALVDADCDWIIVCPCGFEIKDTKKEEDLLSSKTWWQSLRAVQQGKVVIVDGNQMFARPGPRLVDALEFLVGLLHNKPELIPERFPWAWWDTHVSPKHNTIATTLESADSSSTSSNHKTVCSSKHEAVIDRDDDVPNDVSSSNAAASSNLVSQHAQQGRQHAQQGGQPEPAVSQHAAQETGQHAQEGGQRKWRAAPYMGPEIEEAHEAAIEAGLTTYVDPATGYKVMTEQALRHQSVCCANRCRHCPFGHYKVPATRGHRINTITEPTVLRINRKDAQAGRYTLSMWNDTAMQSPDEATSSDLNRLHLSEKDSECDRHSLHSLQFAEPTRTPGSSSTGELEIVKPNSSKSSMGMSGSPDCGSSTSERVHVAVFYEGSGRIWGSKQVTMHDVMKEHLQSGQSFVAIPVSESQDRHSLHEVNQLLTTAGATLCRG